ncbi:MAG: hypothetical protein JXQ74_01165 [Alphaproteobacteria bacterium]|nr:hypothetical protein [Alphaproteobacteria bacterium]
MRRRQERGKLKTYFWWGIALAVVFLSIYVPPVAQQKVEKTLEVQGK